MKRKYLLLVILTIGYFGFSQNRFPTATNSNVVIDGGRLQIKKPSTTGGWARGVHYLDQNNTRYAGMGILGSGETPTRMYIGYGASPWAGGAGMYMLPDGNVGIGQLAPVATLDVNGTFRANSNMSGERKIYMEAPSTGNHRGNGTQNATGLVYRMDNPASGDPIFQVRSQGEAVRFFVEHDGWTGSNHNSAWFGGSKGNYFKGSVGIGTTSPDAKLAVNGVVHSKEVRVDLNGWSDFVFKEDYNLPTLKEVEQHIREKGHLKDIPSAEEVKENGVRLGEMDARLLQKIEELTLYTIQLQKQVETLRAQNIKQQREIDQLKTQ
ncbi:protein bicaudal D homolog [Sinomicrobium kalidii]|uniref:protein bicaudal D homolog n=1 Tax=Sinomicrobium kalidii TaxID=2900738 RepID=UPI001E4C4758|nr:protein bicaudal D homolog [Sinomicrobium kalidii]UGU18146.1 protein bicaudal D homolog [Sinomicrobium kalidii]